MLTCLERIDRWTAAGPEAWLALELAALHHALSELQALWVTHIALEEEAIGVVCSPPGYKGTKDTKQIAGP